MLTVPGVPQSSHVTASESPEYNSGHSNSAFVDVEESVIRVGAAETRTVPRAIIVFFIIVE